MMGLIMKYFVLNPTSSDVSFAKASRIAMTAFAESIRATNEELANSLINWVSNATLFSLEDELVVCDNAVNCFASTKGCNHSLHHSKIKTCEKAWCRTGDLYAKCITKEE